ncbi:T9SS type A sorting domain-containing protein [Flavobacterium sp. H122]|uniref:T9SS type A sorting domain-containing protein n=1 Tax=Flavobacterium sp. H122 TaxID=2529860 RepID=UPI0010AA6BE1|nr:T9SS type A sorting domain-containing protein [Flavobacterium sp. H122]
MIKTTFTKANHNLLLIVCFWLFFSALKAQTAPENTRFLQLNTSKGSSLDITEASENFVYHVGTASNSEIGFDNYNSYTNVGLTDMYILKSNVSDGNNIWMKTFHAGNSGIISPKYVYIDNNENVFVFGQFTGTITTQSNSITSSASVNSFLLKIDANGNPLWVSSFSNPDTNFSFKTKIASDSSDVFIVYGKNQLARLNNTDGSLIYNNSYPNVVLNSIALKNTDIYLAGGTSAANVTLGTETMLYYGSGFVLKSDKNANFDSSVKVYPNQVYSGYGNAVVDLAFTNDGNLVFSGFTFRDSYLIAESGSNYNYTYTPTALFSDGTYHFVSKIDPTLNTISFHRTSSKITTQRTYLSDLGISSGLKIVPNPTANDFKILLKWNTTATSSYTLTQANASTASLSTTLYGDTINLLGNFDNSGNIISGSQPTNINTIQTANSNYFYISSNINKSRFTTQAFDFSGTSLWIKQKNNSIAGSLSKSYVKHLHSQKNDLFFTSLVEGKNNFFGTQVNNDSGVKSRHITRLGQDGLPKWYAQFYPDQGVNELNISDDFACVDKDDNFLFLSNVSGSNSVFTDASGNLINFPQTTGTTKALIKVDKNGNYLWSKKIIPASSVQFEGAITTDGNGDVYLILSFPGASGTTLTIDNTIIGSTSPTLSIIKLNANDGSIIYSKNYNYRCYMFIPVFDSNNNLYAFTEPMSANSSYIFDSISFPGSTQGSSHLMLKFNNVGDVVFGKDFYANSSNYFYSWPNDVAFDGTNFILNGTLLANSTSDFVGLDLVTIPRSYTGNSYEGFFAKIDTSGNVLWQRSLGTNNTAFSSYTNLDLDENNNFYVYYSGIKDKLKINGTEYNFNTVKGEKALIKFDTNGNQSYVKSVDYGNQHASIDVFGEDKINVTSFTTENNILNYPVNNLSSSNAYVATFGILDMAYLTPEKNYAELSAITISNNENNANTFSFDLINNVNWTATSDQSWLNLSHLNLTGRNSLSTSISGSGDAKITLTAETNSSSNERSANVTLSGNGVVTKTILVTQKGTLSNPENEFNTDNIVLHPNPALSTINFSESVKAVEIFDISGKTVKVFNGLNSSFDISNLDKGVYFLKVKTQQDILFTRKLIKE